MNVERLVVDILEQGVQLWVEGGELCYRASRPAMVPALRETLRQHKAEIVGLLDGDRRYAIPSFSQQRQWSLDRLEPDDGGYNIPNAWHIRGKLDVAALQVSLRELVRRHEVLRTVYVTFDKRLVQSILRHWPASGQTLSVADLRGLGPAVRDVELRRVVESEACRPFDLAAEPQFRALLLRHAASEPGREEHWLFVNMHHIASDGWSYGVFQRELMTLYTASCRGPGASLPPDLPIQYADFAAWQREWLSGERLEGLLRYWRRQLGGHDLVLRLPSDRPRPAVPAYRSARIPFELPGDLVGALKRLSSRADATLYMLLVAALVVLLHRMTGQLDVTVGSPIANRRHKETEGLIGFFANALVLRGDLSGVGDHGLDFQGFLRRIRDMMLAAYDHQDLPLEKLVEDLRPERHPNRNPLYQVLFGMRKAPRTSTGGAGTLKPIELEFQPVRLDLQFFCTESETGLHGSVSYPVALFDRTTIERSMSRLERLLSDIINDSHRDLLEYSVLSVADEEEIRSRDRSAPPGCWWIESPEGRRLTIRPELPDRRVRLLDTRSEEVPAHIVGEVHLGETGTAATGDLGRRYRDGSLEIIGSTDGAVWRRGRRVSPGAVEAAVLALPEVLDGAVVARHTEEGETQLVAYVVPAGKFYPEGLAAGLKGLPAPDSWTPIAALPLLDDGRVDVSALFRVAVVDTPLLDEIERSIAALPGIDRVAVVEREVARPQPLLHLADLLPDAPRRSRGASQPEPTSTASPPESTATRSAKRPAIVHGPSLEVDPEGPRVLTEVLERAALVCPRHGIVYLADGDVEQQSSYPELLSAAERILSGLRDLELRPGDPVIFQFDRNQDFIPAFWACVLGGFVPVPLSTPSQYHPDNSDVRKLHDVWRLFDHPPVLAGDDVLGKLRSLADRADPTLLRLTSLSELRTVSRDTSRHPSQPDDVALILVTSGSTGTPKCVPQSHRALLAQARGNAQMARFTSDDIWFNWMPLEHVGGVVFSHILSAVVMAQQVHAEKDTILRNPLRWLDAIERFRATFTWAPNFAYGLINGFLEEGGAHCWDLSSLRVALNAGEAIVARTARRFLELLEPFGLPASTMHPAWGMSETCSGVVLSDRFSRASTSDEDRFVELGSPIPGVSLRIVDEGDAVVGEGTVGDLQVRGAPVTSGYCFREELNREAFTGDGWFRTGDRGFLHDGRLTITGRTKNEIILNGIKYASHELESIVEQVDGVSASYTSACAVRTADSQTDELAIFFHHPAFHSPTATDEQRRQALAAIRQALTQKAGVNPDHLVPVEEREVPKTSIGKIRSALLGQRLVEGAYRERQKRVDLMEGRNALPSWFFKRVWRPRGPGPKRSRAPSGVWLVFADQRGLGERIAASRPEDSVVRVEPAQRFERPGLRHYRIDPKDREHYRLLFRSLSEESVVVSEILHLWTWDLAAARRPPDLSQETARGFAAQLRDYETAQDLGLYSLLFLFQAIAPLSHPKLVLTVVSSRAQAVSPAVPVDYLKAPLLGLLASLFQQISGLKGRHVDLAGEDLAAETAFLLAELDTPPTEPEVAWRDGVRQVPRLERYAPVPASGESACTPRFKPGGFYLLSGGMGGIGTELAHWLLRCYDARLLIVGRTPVPEVEPADPASREAILFRSYESLAHCGGEVRYEAIDVADGAALEPLVAELEVTFGRPLDGILHLAGLSHESLLAEETRARVEEVLQPKVAGTWWLHRLLERRSEGQAGDAWIVGFSSVLATIGTAATGAYAAANRFLEAYSYHQNHFRGLRSYCYSWSLWEDTGMGRGVMSSEASRSRGFSPVKVDEGILSLQAALAGGESQLLIGLTAGRFLRRRLLAEEPRLLETIVCWAAEARPDPDQGATPALAHQESMELVDRFGTRLSAAWIRLPELPRAADGSVDTEALLGEIGALSGAAERTAPRTPLEKRIAGIWEDLLGVKQLSIYDDFFQLGGQSLLAAQIVARMCRELEMEIPQHLLFSAPTIALLASGIEQLGTRDDRAPVGGPRPSYARSSR